MNQSLKTLEKNCVTASMYKAPLKQLLPTLVAWYKVRTNSKIIHLPTGVDWSRGEDRSFTGKSISWIPGRMLRILQPNGGKHIQIISAGVFFLAIYFVVKWLEQTWKIEIFFRKKQTFSNKNAFQ